VDQRTILFVSMGTGDALRAAKGLGLHVVMATDTELKWQRNYVDEQIAINPYDGRYALKEIMDYSVRYPINGVVTFDERAVPTAAAIAQALGLPGNTYEAAYAARNKFVMRTRFYESGLLCPRFGIAKTPDVAEQLARESIGFPLILKPVFGFASQGVVRINEPEELWEFFPVIKRIVKSYEAFIHDDRYGDYLLLEEYLSGREVAVDAVLAEGKANWIGIFDKPNPLEGPTFEETIYVTPSNESDQIQSEIFKEVERGARSLGLRTGPLHAEVRITRDGIAIIEIGARPIGGMCARAHNYCLGLDYSEIVLRNALGDPVEVRYNSHIPAGVMMVPVPGAGRLVGVEGVEEARRVHGVRDVFIMARPGDVIRTFPEQGCYLGFILATGSSTREVEQSLNQSHSLLQFELEPIDNSVGSYIRDKA